MRAAILESQPLALTDRVEGISIDKSMGESRMPAVLFSPEVAVSDCGIKTVVTAQDRDDELSAPARADPLASCPFIASLGILIFSKSSASSLSTVATSIKL